VLVTKIGDEAYVAVTTFKRDGTGVETPVWVVPFGENRVAFWSSASVGKAKRLRRDPRILLLPCDREGNTREGAAPVAGAAEFVYDDEFEAILDLLEVKYGEEFKAMVEGARKVFPDSLGIVVTFKTEEESSRMAQCDGNWKVSIDTPIGAQELELTFVSAGTVLSGRADSQDFEGGTIDGDELAWTVDWTTPMPMSLEFTATVSGDTIDGTAMAGADVSAFEGTRA
jgi:PPOX class probable F420-dependent enzyme